MATTGNRPPVRPAPPPSQTGEDDERGLVGKISTGAYDQIDVGDTAEATASVASMFGMPGQVVATAAEGLSEDVRSQKRKEWYRKNAGINLERDQTYSRAARRELERLDNSWINKVIHVGVVAAAGLAGGFAGAALLSFLPLGGLIGALAGTFIAGFVAEKIYCGTCTTHEQDGVKRAADDFVKQRQRQKVSAVEAAATLLANMPDERVANTLENIADTRDFAQALKTDKGMAALLTIMKDEALQDKLRARYGIPVSLNASVYEQYAELLNNGLDGRAIILDPKLVHDAAQHLEIMAMQQAPDAQDAPVLPQRLLPNAGRNAGKPLRTA